MRRRGRWRMGMHTRPSTRRSRRPHSIPLIITQPSNIDSPLKLMLSQLGGGSQVGHSTPPTREPRSPPRGVTSCWILERPRFGSTSRSEGGWIEGTFGSRRCGAGADRSTAGQAVEYKGHRCGRSRARESFSFARPRHDGIRLLPVG